MRTRTSMRRYATYTKSEIASDGGGRERRTVEPEFGTRWLPNARRRRAVDAPHFAQLRDDAICGKRSVRRPPARYPGVSARLKPGAVLRTA